MNKTMICHIGTCTHAQTCYHGDHSAGVAYSSCAVGVGIGLGNACLISRAFAEELA